jgi:hypothetical protein
MAPPEAVSANPRRFAKAVVQNPLWETGPAALTLASTEA